MIEYFRNFNILKEEELKELVNIFRSVHLSKGDYFIQQGKICTEIAYVKSGFCRSFYYSEKGEDLTYCITFPDSLITAYSSYIQQAPTLENIQAISDTELLITTKSELETLSDKSPNLIKLLKFLAEREYIQLEKRIFQMQKDKALERYKELISRHPFYISHIPLQYLASYLGITQRHLSRIRKEIL